MANRFLLLLVGLGLALGLLPAVGLGGLAVGLKAGVVSEVFASTVIPPLVALSEPGQIVLEPTPYRNPFQHTHRSTLHSFISLAVSNSIAWLILLLAPAALCHYVRQRITARS